MGKDKRIHKFLSKIEEEYNKEIKYRMTVEGEVIKMKKQKNKNKDSYYNEAVFNIAAYNCSRNYTISGHNSKRALSSVLAITDYLHNLPETSKKEIKNI